MTEKAKKIQGRHPTLKLDHSVEALTFIKMVCIFPAEHCLDIMQKNVHEGVHFAMGCFSLRRWPCPCV